MKHIKTYRYIPVVIMLLFAGSILSAQVTVGEEAKKKAAVEEEFNIKQDQQQKDLEIQFKKQRLEQERKTMEMERDFAEKRRQLDLEFGRKEKELEIERKAGQYARGRESARSSWASTGNGQYLIGSYGQHNQSQLTLRNGFTGGSDSSRGDFDVESGSRQFKCIINGKVKSGKIHIKVNYPDGKKFKELTITSAAEISYTQSLIIKDEDAEKYVGSWKYEVKSEKAEGNYMLQIMTN